MNRLLIFVAVCLLVGCETTAPAPPALRTAPSIVAKGDDVGSIRRARYDDGRRAPAEAVVRGR